MAAGRVPDAAGDAERRLGAPGAGLFGLWDMWSFTGLGAIVSSGLGGGSLIYANVALRKDAENRRRRPDHWSRRARAHYARWRRCSAPSPTRGRAPTPKTRAAGRRADRGAERRAPAAGARRRRAPASPADGTANVHEAPRDACRLCGECASGVSTGRRTPSTTRTSAPRSTPGRRARLLRCPRADREGDGWRVRYRQHLAARNGHPSNLLDPVASPSARSAPRRRARRRHSSAPRRPAAQPRRAPRLARAWGAGSRATATCCSSCSTPTATSIPPPAR